MSHRKKYKDIGDYIVYCDARVFSKKKGIFLTPLLGKGRSRYFSIKVPKKMQLHRLVATHFCANKFNKPEVNHKDGNKLNNNASNLEWCTRQHNVDHAVKYGLRRTTGEQSGRAKLSLIDVMIAREAIANGFKLASIARYYKMHPTSIWALKGKSWNSL